MIQLVVVIMGISLLSYVIMAGINYSDMGTIKVREHAAYWTTLSLGLAQSWSNTQLRYGRAPHDVDELIGNSNGLRPPNDYSVTELMTTFNGWCIEGQAQEYDLRAMVHLSEKYPAQYGLSNACGQLSGIDTDWADRTQNDPYPRPIALTYRLSNI